MEREGDQIFLTAEEQLNFGVDSRDNAQLIYPGPTGGGRTLRVSQQEEGILRVQGILAIGKERSVFVNGDINNLKQFLESKPKV